MLSNVAFQQKATILIIEVDDFNTVGAEPIQASGEGAAFANDNGAEAKLTYKAAAVPTWRERRNHNQIAVTALAASPAECVRLAMNTWIALLHAPIVAAADEFAVSRKDGAADRDSAFGATQARFIERDLEHLLVSGTVHQRNPLVPA